jgi:hypothetical protein
MDAVAEPEPPPTGTEPEVLTDSLCVELFLRTGNSSLRLLGLQLGQPNPEIALDHRVELGSQTFFVHIRQLAMEGGRNTTEGIQKLWIKVALASLFEKLQGLFERAGLVVGPT